MSCPSPLRILIVKMSSLGDIIQAFVVLENLHARFPDAKIDWVSEERFSSLLFSNPHINQVIPIDLKGRQNLLKAFTLLRKEKYDLVFDFQANSKSALITLLSRGKKKIGYSLFSCREWLNVLATNCRFYVSKKQNIRSFYLELLDHYFGSCLVSKEKKRVSKNKDLARVSHTIPRDDVPDYTDSPRECEKCGLDLEVPLRLKKIMVCPGSRWDNKKLKESTLTEFLRKIEEIEPAYFFLVSGDEKEKQLNQKMLLHLKKGELIHRLPIAAWQNLMEKCDLVIAVDSSALHLAATTTTPTFSIFGPTSSDVFRPLGAHHVSFQGKCPYGKAFIKQCPSLRSCRTGACVKEIEVEKLFQAYSRLSFKLHF